MGDYDDGDEYMEAFYDDDDREYEGYGGGGDSDREDFEERMGGGARDDGDGDSEFKGSYADKERTGGGGFADERAYGVYRTREEIFIGKLAAAFSNIANKGLGGWENQLSKIPNAYYMHPTVLATAMYAIDNETNPDFLDDFTVSKKAAGYETKRTAYVVNRAADVARRNAGDVNVVDVYRYYKVVKGAL
jgi:hypothetical protein